jgi:hypothetical protein
MKIALNFMGLIRTFPFNLTLVLQYKEVLGKGAFKKVYPFILFAMLTLNLYYERKKRKVQLAALWLI